MTDGAFKNNTPEMQVSRPTFLTSKISVAEYEVDFSFVRMSRFWLYHLLWFTIGPMALPVLLLIEGVPMCRNMAFIP